MPFRARFPRQSQLLLLFSLPAILLFGPGCWRQPPTVVQTEKVARRNVTERVTATGKVQPFLQVKISPEVAGEIIELPVKEGQPVAKGALLVRIKRDFYEASRNSAEANRNSSQANHQSSRASLLTAEANVRKAESEFRRNAELFNRKLLSESVYDEVRTALENARAQVEVTHANSTAAGHQVQVASAALKKAEEDLLKTTILSPIDGTVSKLTSEVGERVVGTGMMAGTEIMTIADLNKMEARVEVGEVDVVKVVVGQRARLEVDSFRDRKIAGLVTQIANSAKTQGMGTQQEATKFEVRIRITEKEFFRPGMSVTADIETTYRTNVLTVPIQSVTTRLPKGSVRPDAKKDAKSVQRDKEEKDAADLLGISEKKRQKEGAKPIDVVFTVVDAKAKLLPVKRGISDDNYYEIIEGVTEGLDVVSGGFKAIARELDEDKPAKVDNDKARKAAASK
ncbi:MAG: efflux RND transporter periplasmic adaptor subunit [Pedosphaera sp.]|nr:efflux RND transporter periplasmic adaptor subunit [Pedosphaera sp.]